MGITIICGHCDCRRHRRRCLLLVLVLVVIAIALVIVIVSVIVMVIVIAIAIVIVFTIGSIIVGIVVLFLSSCCFYCLSYPSFVGLQIRRHPVSRRRRPEAQICRSFILGIFLL